MNDPQVSGREPKVGGPLDPAEHLYIARGADKEFIDLLKVGEFVNLITSRQMGKTSLVYRAMAELRPLGYRFAYFDLSPLKNEPDVRRYFHTLVGELARELELQIDLDAFWADSANKSSSQVLIDFCRKALGTLEGPVVIVLDEIDSTLESARLTYTDDLFTAIRSLYMSRPREPAFKRLTFCLVGVATPNELIKARRTTPYNIGRTIWLGDFDPKKDDLTPLARTLSPDPAEGKALLSRVLYWTGGQPYLTMWMSDELRRERSRDPQAADAWVERTFTSFDQVRSDAHFGQIERFVNRASNGEAVLRLYERVLGGEREADQPANLVYAHLKLSGLVKPGADGVLVIRNLIYRRLFDLAWVQKSRPKRELRRARVATWVVTALLIVSLAGGLAYYQLEVAPLRTQEQARIALQRLGVTLQADYRGWTVVRLSSGRESSRDAQSVLEDAAPDLAIIGSGRESRGLYLDLSSAAIDSLGPLAALSGLRRLDVSSTKISDLAPLAKLANLQELDVSGTPVSNLAPLSGLSDLKQLSISRTSANELTALSPLKGLERFDASWTAIRDLGPLANLTALQQLDVSHTAVSNVAPLAKLAGLRELNLSWTSVKDLTPLKGLRDLRTLVIDGLGATGFNADGETPRLKVLGGSPVGKEARGNEAGHTFRDCEQCPEMVVVPAGEFKMGSPEGEAGRSSDEGPQQNVTISQPFALGKHEVRFDEWTACVQDQVCRPTPDEGYGRGARPAINVSWQDAQTYVDWLSKKTGKNYRLPSEAEWEYAARAKTTAARFWGERPQEACSYANIADRRFKAIMPNLPAHDCDDGYLETAPVGSFRANPFGLHDMIGNVWEWVQDCWNDSHYGAFVDGRPRERGDCGRRVVRGGSWYDLPEFARAAFRLRFGPGYLNDYLGFRVARTL